MGSLPTPHMSTQPHDLHPTEDWLAGCEGFRVASPSSTLGYVEEVRHDPESGRAGELVVRTGMLAGRRLLVPVQEIAGVVLSERLIVLQGPWLPARTGASSLEVSADAL
jgi:hypothetical protein